MVAARGNGGVAKPAQNGRDMLIGLEEPRSFEEILQRNFVQGRDFRIAFGDSNIDKCLLAAPHGGGIEPGTSEIMRAVAEQELSVVLSSHLISDLERVCDYLIVLVGSRVLVAGELEDLLATHHRLTGPRRDPDTLPADQHVISASHTDVQTTLLVRVNGAVRDPSWTVSEVGLEDLVLAYMSQAADGRRALVLQK